MCFFVYWFKKREVKLNLLNIILQNYCKKKVLLNKFRQFIIFFLAMKSQSKVMLITKDFHTMGVTYLDITYYL